MVGILSPMGKVTPTQLVLLTLAMPDLISTRFGFLTPTPSPITEMEIRAVQYQVIRLRLME